MAKEQNTAKEPRDNLSEIERAAFAVAIQAPARRGKYSYSATVPWQAIEDLRAAFQARGWDMQRAKAFYVKEVEKARKKAR